ncbi:hypothetical protein Tco_0677884 [Tanacetum coccineum]|uniref:Uncharacterized protein n=1 Tax=Tanacetum coccineum TaxID=301880 RepID=A0ABQ4XE70_9ASTR
MVVLTSGRAILVDEAGNPLKKVESPGDYDSEDEGASVDNDMACSMASERVGFGTQSLIEQWRDSYGNGDYDEDPYDDDMYEGQDLPQELQVICDNLDIRVVVDIVLSAHANARRWYEQKNQDSKQEKTATAHAKAFKAAEKKTHNSSLREDETEHSTVVDIMFLVEPPEFVKERVREAKRAKRELEDVAMGIWIAGTSRDALSMAEASRR